MNKWMVFVKNLGIQSPSWPTCACCLHHTLLTSGQRRCWRLATSLQEVHKQAGWGFGQAGWKLPTGSNAPRAVSAAVWVESLLLHLAVTTLWFFYLAKVLREEGWAAALGVPSSSLEKPWVCQPPPSQTTQKRINKTMKDQQRRFCQNRSSWGRWLLPRVWGPAGMSELSELAETMWGGMFSGENVEERKRRYKPGVLMTG